MNHLPHRRHAGPMFAPGSDAMPVGAVIAFAGQLGATAAHVTTAIEAWGWTLCDGRLLDCGRFPELFAALGHLYDNGADPDKFGLPDYRGYFLRGVDGGSGNDGDAAQRSASDGSLGPGVGTRQDDALRNHEHGFDATGAPTMEATGPPGSVPTRLALDSKPAPTAMAGISAHETRPKNMSVHYLIRFSGRLRHHC
jgi:microcystin-dependent protein